MSADLIIWMPDVLEAPWIWWQSETDCGEVRTEAEKASLKALDFKILTIVLSGQSVRFVPHDLPQMRADERRKAAAIFVEDILAGASKDQHVVIGDGREGYVAVISKARMDALTQKLSILGLSAQAIVADFDALPLHIGSVLLTDRLIFSGPNGYTIDPNWAELERLNPARRDSVNPRDVYAILTELDVRSAINLAQGEYAPAQNLIPEITAFKRVAVLLFMLAMSWLAWQGVQGRAINAQTEVLKTEASDLYFNAFGKRTNNPALDVTRAIKTDTQSDADFLFLSAILFESLSEIDGIEIDRLQYDNSNNEISLRIFYPSFASVSALEKNILERDAIFVSGGVREQSDRMVGAASLKMGTRS